MRTQATFDETRPPTGLVHGAPTPDRVHRVRGYGLEEAPAFPPRTQAFMFFQSGSSSDANCLPPWWVSARPPASGAKGMRKNRLRDGLPGTTSFETTSKLWRDWSSVQKLIPGGSISRLSGPPPCRLI